MKIALSYDADQIKTLIANDIENKIGVSIPEKELKIMVRSKQNYRENEFEHGELKCNLEVNV